MTVTTQHPQEGPHAPRGRTNSPTGHPRNPPELHAPHNPEHGDLADPNTRRAHTAMQLWGCPRPDKSHFITHQDATTALDRHRTKPDHDPTARVYRCACGAFVWGRSKKR